MFKSILSVLDRKCHITKDTEISMEVIAYLTESFSITAISTVIDPNKHTVLDMELREIRR
jgi:hypothetical protein